MNISPKMGNRYSQHSFAQIPSVNNARSKFDRSFGAKDTIMFDQLTPIFVDEVLPGDTINLNIKSFTRLATQIKPLMDRAQLDFFAFFVPNRLVWNNWEKFMGAQENPGDSIDYLIPQVESGAGASFAVGSIYDKLGLPTGVNNVKANSLIMRAYNLIWNEWFRDQNLQDSIPVPKDDGPDAPSDFALLKRAKPHDYFTSVLPWPQKGPNIAIPLGTSAPVVSNNQAILVSKTGAGSVVDRNLLFAQSSNQDILYSGSQNTNSGNMYFGSQTGLATDLTTATAATINAFREAIMLQSLLELDARGGTRYVEILKAHFGVTAPDFRLQRPEFLSYGSVEINQHVTPQTSESGTTPQANLAAYSTSLETGNRIGFSKSFVEHGHVIVLVQPRGEVTYQQGLNRMWSRRTKHDLFWPKLQELGEQEVYNGELYYQGTSADGAIFGYQERYAEYRYRPSEIRGEFRSTFAQSLDVWHLAQEFTTLPPLNSDFITANTPIERNLVVTTGPDLLCDFWFDYKHARPMVTYGVPATLGRF